MRAFIKRIYADHLYRNSLYLILNNVVTTGFGFVFWMICARLFNTEQVGYATALISSVTLVASFSYLGLTTAMIRYYPTTEDKDKLVNSCLNLSLLVSLVVAVVFLLLIPIASPKLSLVLENWKRIGMFIGFTLVWVAFTVLSSFFIARRDASKVVVKSLIFSIVKVALPFMLVMLGLFGIVTAYHLAALVGVVYGLFFFKYRFTIDFKLIRQMFKFSFGNYIAGLLGMLPSLLLPLFIANRIGASETAYFYVAWMVAGLLFIIPGAVASSLLTEGSHSSGSLEEKTKKAYLFSYLMLIPGIIIVLLLGKWLLLLFGKEYSSEGLVMLQILAVSSIFVAWNNIRLSKFNVLHRVDKIMWVNGTIAVVTILGCVIFANGYLWMYGLMYGIGQMAGGVVR